MSVILGVSGSEVARATANLLAKGASLGTARDRAHNEGPTDENMLALRNARGDLEVAAIEYTRAVDRLGVARARAA